MPLAIGQRVICTDTTNGAEHIPTQYHYIIHHIRESGGILLRHLDSTYYRASRFAPYYPFLYTRGAHYDPQLSTPVLPEFPAPSPFDADDSPPLRVSPRGVSLDTHYDGIPAYPSPSWARAANSIDSTVTRLREDPIFAGARDTAYDQQRELMHRFYQSLTPRFVSVDTMSERDYYQYQHHTFDDTEAEEVVQRPRGSILSPSEQHIAQARTRLDHLRGYRGASSNRPPRG